IGGVNDELPHSLITNENGELIVFGTSSSLNYPTTTGAISEDFQGGSTVAPEGVGVEYVNGSDIVVTKLSASGGALIGSTFIGGSGNDGVNNSDNLKFNYADEFRGEVELDSQGNILIASCTNSIDFPLSNQIQGPSLNLDGVVFKMNPDLSQLIWSTYYGGDSDDACYSIAMSPIDEVVVCGGTTSQGLEGTNNGWQTNNNGGIADGFIVKLDADGTSVLAGTYVGSSAYDQAYFVELDDEENIHIYGQTMAPGSTFIIDASYGDPGSGMLVTKFNPNLTELIWSTVFGTGSGKPNLCPTAFLVDVCGKIYMSGWGGSTNINFNENTDNVFNMETTDDAFQETTNGSDFYLLVIESDASALVYSSFFGGGTSNEHVDGGTSRFNRKGQIYQSVCAGCGGNSDFPIFPPNAVSATNNSGFCNNGVFKFDFQLPISVADFFVPSIGCVNEPIPFTNTSAGFENVVWDFGDDTGSTLNNPVHTYEEAGTYEITLVVS
ncbi:MAG: PKD domain-containing protein, partial [Flavobacteriales bacterium]